MSTDYTNPEPPPLTPMMKAAILQPGAKEWIGRNGVRRIYLSRWALLVGVTINTNDSNYITEAWCDDRRIKPGSAGVILKSKAWVDATGLTVEPVIGPLGVHAAMLAERLRALLIEQSGEVPEREGPAF